MHSNFQDVIMEDLKKIIMVNIWKCFPQKYEKVFWKFRFLCAANSKFVCMAFT